jgi:hypothetical protein
MEALQPSHAVLQSYRLSRRRTTNHDPRRTFAASMLVDSECVRLYDKPRSLKISTINTSCQLDSAACFSNVGKDDDWCVTIFGIDRDTLFRNWNTTHSRCPGSFATDMSPIGQDVVPSQDNDASEYGKLAMDIKRRPKVRSRCHWSGLCRKPSSYSRLGLFLRSMFSLRLLSH